MTEETALAAGSTRDTPDPVGRVSNALNQTTTGDRIGPQPETETVDPNPRENTHDQQIRQPLRNQQLHMPTRQLLQRMDRQQPRQLHITLSILPRQSPRTTIQGRPSQSQRLPTTRLPTHTQHTRKEVTRCLPLTPGTHKLTNNGESKYSRTANQSVFGAATKSICNYQVITPWAPAQTTNHP